MKSKGSSENWKLQLPAEIKSGVGCARTSKFKNFKKISTILNSMKIL